MLASPRTTERGRSVPLVPELVCPAPALIASSKVRHSIRLFADTIATTFAGVTTVRRVEDAQERSGNINIRKLLKAYPFVDMEGRTEIEEGCGARVGLEKIKTGNAASRCCL